MARDRVSINDGDRQDWVNNDEGLYNEFRRSRMGMRAFIRANREMIDSCIRNVTQGSKPAHYMAYGG